MSTFQKQRWLIKLYFVIDTLKGRLVSLPFIPKAIRIKLASNTNVNSFEGFNWPLFDLMFYSGNGNRQHITEILSISERLNICVYGSDAEISSAKEFWQSRETSSRCSGRITANSTIFRMSFEEGDVLNSLPKASTKENLYCFINVFSGLSDSDCLTILNNAREAIGPFTATLAIIDSIQPDNTPSQHKAMNDLPSLLEKNAKQRTLSQWKELITNSGFTLTEIVDLRSKNKVLVLNFL